MSMIFTRSFKQFDFNQFYGFIRALIEDHRFRNILFSPDNIQLFTPEQLTHAAPNHDLTHPDSFIGHWKQNEPQVRSVKFRFTGANGSPDIQMAVQLDDRTIALDEARGIDPGTIDKVLANTMPGLVLNAVERQPLAAKVRKAERCGDWEIVESLPEGGQSWTYKVIKKGDATREIHVLKRLKNLSQQRLTRFEREVQACLLLSHPNIIRIVDHRLTGDTPFFVAEYCDGGALDYNHLEPLQIPNRLELFTDICRAVGFAHAEGVIHRDLKPQNIFLRGEWRMPVVGDFGLCLIQDDNERLTESLEAVGPRYYTAPELEDGRYEEAKPSADIYSLGKLLYWFLSGRIFSREKHREPKYDLTQGSTDPAIFFVYELLDKMLATDPTKRFYEDGNAVVAAISEIMRKITRGANPVGLTLPQHCIYCGSGTYRPIYSSYPATGKMPFNTPYDLGIQLINEGSRKWLFLACDNCGNVQVFRADQAKDSTIWNRQ